MDYISDELWGEILKWGPYEKGFRDALNFHIEKYKTIMEWKFDIEDYKLRKSQLNKILNLTESLIESLGSADTLVYSYLVMDRNIDEFSEKYEYHGYRPSGSVHHEYHHTINGKALPLLRGMALNAIDKLNDVSKISYVKRRKLFADEFVDDLEELYFMFRGASMRRGKKTPISWILPILRILDSSINESAADRAIKEAIIIRNRHYKDPDKRCSIMFVHRRNLMLERFSSGPVSYLEYEKRFPLRPKPVDIFE